MNNTKNIFSQVLLFTLILLVAACGGATATPEEVEPAVVKVQLLPFLSYGPLFIAEAEGYFAEQNLEIETVDFQRTADALTPLIQGDIDVYTGSNAIGFLSAIASGATIKVVANRGYLDSGGCDYYAIVANKEVADSGVLDVPVDLSGLQVNNIPASITEYFFDLALAEVGYTLEEVEQTNLGTVEVFDAVQKGDVALTSFSEPWVTRSVDTGLVVVWVPVQKIAPDFLLGLIAFGPSLLLDNPGVGQRFVTAYLKGVQQFNEGKTERNLEIITEATGLDSEILERACWPAIPSDGGIDFGPVDEFQNWAIDKGLLDAGVTEEQYWDGSFIEYANEAREP